MCRVRPLRLKPEGLRNVSCSLRLGVAAPPSPKNADRSRYRQANQANCRNGSSCRKLKRSQCVKLALAKHCRRNHVASDDPQLKPSKAMKTKSLNLDGVDEETVLRFKAKLVESTSRYFEGTPCLEWAGAKSDCGYGSFKYQGKPISSHRFAYALWVKKLEVKGDCKLVIDHRCRNRACCSPAHLEMITFRENVLRGTSPPAIEKAKTHCLLGHPFSGKNLRISGHRRICRKCDRERASRYKQEKRRSSRIERVLTEQDVARYDSRNRFENFAGLPHRGRGKGPPGPNSRHTGEPPIQPGAAAEAEETGLSRRHFSR